MKYLHVSSVLVFLLLFFFVEPLLAEDARVGAGQADHQRAELVRQAQAEKAAAVQSAREIEAAIRTDRQALEQAVAELEAKKKRLNATVSNLHQEETQITAEESDVDVQLHKIDGMVKELIGQIRINAKDLDELIGQDPQYARRGKKGQPLNFLSAVAGDEKFPGMEDIRTMDTALLEIIRSSGEVNLKNIVITSRSGRESEAEVVMVGPFTGVYRLGGETGFLNFTPGSDRLFALANLPDSSLRRDIASYMDGSSPAVPVDISRGGALRQISHRVSFIQQIHQGGPIVWPILALLLFGVLIVAERSFYLLRYRQLKPPLIARIRILAGKGNWGACEKLCAGNQWKKRPMGRVLGAGLSVRTLDREEIENVLHEAILAEVPRLERGLSTLGMFTTISPLLGLLGTVTGMINVFHVITLYGTSDPRMMSSGISEALVTTMLGLSVAIPLMLLHNMISRGVDRIIGDMEEQSVSLVNLIFKLRSQESVLRGKTATR
ncbi:MotA/TolQ/ExbB proton channel family protein [Desulforhopalus vacuolatus]|uniref:MotA/TolQ/ExbB proton channel family protein n=1 Tax=Desulforhopalus vacuolatus TaxID=40414 RepID=UPI0019632789|nr:MotA/TolQ/ExbB proton channel family protein [Desulforhopalus vacuolatus]MBM9520790.1 MotA/TolQ/ExbB proton channel family protein [Desulforhopalus vacuolatus]